MAKLVSYDDFCKSMVYYQSKEGDKKALHELNKGSIHHNGMQVPFFISTLRSGKMLPYVSDGLCKELGLTPLETEREMQEAKRLALAETAKQEAKRIKAQKKAEQEAKEAAEAEQAAKVALFDKVLQDFFSGGLDDN